uniref:Xanthine/uracil permease n=1 Tax=Araucaria cunninghamii TaxID=56994 RepID=A0A0D6QX84_ARACU
MENEGISSRREEEEQQQSGLRERLIGNYNWGFLCTPRIACGGRRDLPPFFAKDEKISVFLSAVMGLQHALSMVGGIITPPILISSSAGFSTEIQAYLVSAALIVSAFASFIQILQIKIPLTSYVVGSGLLSVMGITFAVVPIVNQVVSVLTACTCNGVSCSVNGSCKACNQKLEGKCLSGEDAYGHILGTIVVCCWLQVAASFCPPRILRRIFPPTVTGISIILIGVSLITTGFEYWGGGSYCASQVLTSKALCTGNGDVGLGFVVFSALIVVEMFGSPFMRNTQVIIGLAIGMLVASLTHVTRCEDNCELQSCKNICYDVLPEGLHYNLSTHSISGMPKSIYENGTVCVEKCNPKVCNTACHEYRYVTSTKIANADWVTFLWVHTFPLKFYAPAVLPLVFALITATMECIGDVTATVEASHLEPFGPNFEKSIQGAVLADGLNTFWAALGTMTPVTTYAQNNGVISLSRCASRRAGIACCMWLLLLGVFSKFAAVLVSIPDCVLGGMTTFLFTSVVVSGIRVLNLKEGLTRRNRFIAIISLGIGLGVNLVSAWVNISGQSNYPLQGNLWPVNPDWSASYRGFRDAIILVLSNGFSVGGLLALVLNLVLPFDDDEKELSLKQSLVE